MSRAFVKEQDDAPEELPERPVSANPNFVTPRGLSLIDAEIAGLRQELAQAQQANDKSRIARASRDLRYWQQRRATAHLIEARPTTEKIAFGHRVTLLHPDNRQQTLTIVGEDEADPAKGLIAYIAPVARALLGKAIGDEIAIVGHQAEIIAIA